MKREYEVLEGEGEEAYCVESTCYRGPPCCLIITVNQNGGATAAPSQTALLCAYEGHQNFSGTGQIRTPLYIS